MNKDNRRVLVLIPCCRTKGALLSEVWETPLPGLPVLRKRLMGKIEHTIGVVGRDKNLECYHV